MDYESKEPVMTKQDRQALRKQRDRNPKGPMKRLYSIPEAAYYLGRTVPALRQMIWAGKLPIRRDGKRIFLDVQDLDTYIDKRKTRYTY